MTNAEITTLWSEATTGDHGDTTAEFVMWFARQIERCSKSAEREAIASMVEHGANPRCIVHGQGRAHGIQIGGPARRAYAAAIRARKDSA